MVKRLAQQQLSVEIPGADAPAQLRSEHMKVPILCLSGDDDQHSHLSEAGHLVRLEVFPTDAQWTGGIAFGGSRIGQSVAQRKAIDEVLEFMAATTESY